MHFKRKKKEKKDGATQIAQLEGTEDEKLAEAILEQDNDLVDGMIGTLQDAEKIGDATLHELEDQGKRLKGVDHSLNGIRRDNQINKEQLRSIRHFFGGAVNKMTSCFHREIKDEWPEEKKRKHRKKHERKSGHDDKHDSGSKNPTTPLFDLYKKNEQGLDKVNDLTNNLQDLAEKMGDEIDFQNDQLDRMFENADKALAEIRANKKKANDSVT